MAVATCIGYYRYKACKSMGLLSDLLSPAETAEVLVYIAFPEAQLTADPAMRCQKLL